LRLLWAHCAPTGERPRVLRKSGAPTTNWHSRGHYIVVAAAVGVLGLPLAAIAAGKPFTDVPSTSPAFRAIMAVADAA
jgi:hypothetical protein